MSIFNLKGFKNNKVKVTYFSSTPKWIDIKTTELHKEVNDINSVILKGKYVISTIVTGSKKKSKYTLKVGIRFYNDKKKNEHKKNTHRQKINI